MKRRDLHNMAACAAAEDYCRKTITGDSHEHNNIPLLWGRKVGLLETRLPSTVEPVHCHPLSRYLPSQ